MAAARAQELTGRMAPGELEDIARLTAITEAYQAPAHPGDELPPLTEADLAALEMPDAELLELLGPQADMPGGASIADTRAAHVDTPTAPSRDSGVRPDAPSAGSGADGAEVGLPDCESLTGLQLAQALTPMSLPGMDGGDLVEAVAAWGRVAAWAQGQQARAAGLLGAELLLLAGPRAGQPGPQRLAGTELAMRLGMTRPAAERLVLTGRMLGGVLQETGSALAAGALDYRKAEQIAGALDGVPLPIAIEVEATVLPRAGRRTHPQVAHDLAKALIEADATEASSRARRARSRRRVSHPRALPDGLAALTAVLPAPDAIALDLALDSAARTAKNDGDARTLDQLRADALAAVGISALRTGRLGPDPAPGTTPTGRAAPCVLGTVGGEPVRLNVTVPLSALLDSTELEAPGGDPHTPDVPAPATQGQVTPGHADPGRADPGHADPGHADPGRAGPGRASPVTSPGVAGIGPQLQTTEAAELEGYGPIDPATARALARAGTWRRLVTDPLSGTVLDVGHTRYRPPPDLARLVRARDRTCTRPGCRTRASACDLDHTIPFVYGGPTALRNLGATCPADHQLKTAGDYRVRQLPGGVFEWTSRSGHTYRREPDGTITHLGRTQPPGRRVAMRDAGDVAGRLGLAPPEDPVRPAGRRDGGSDPCPF